MTRAPSGKAGKAPAEWMVFAAVTLLSLVWLLLISHTPDLMADTARDLLFARDCSKLGQCLTVGAKTSFSQWYQGGTWFQLIAAIQLLGGGVRALQVTVIVLDALSCGAWYLFLSRHFGGFMPVLASLFWLGALGYMGDHSLLWNPSGMALPVVLASAGLLVFAVTRSLLALCVAVFWTGLGMGFHVDCATLLPVELVAAILATRRPWLAELSVLGAFLLGLLPTSLEAARANLVFVLESGVKIPILLAILVLFVAPRFARDRFWRASTGARIAWLAGGAILPSVLGLGWLALHGHEVAMRYTYPALPAALALVALGVDEACRWATRRRGPTARTVLAGACGVVGLCGGIRTERPRWTSADARAIAAKLTASGYSYDAARWHVQGPATWSIITAIGPYMPPPRKPPLPLDMPDILMLRPAPAGAKADSLLHPRGRPPVYLHSIRPWLDIAHGRACIRPAHAAPDVEARCQKLDKRMEAVQGFRYRSRKYPRLYNTSQRAPYVVRFVIPVHPSGDDARRYIWVFNRSRNCPWQIVSVNGLSYEGRLPARAIVLERGQGGSMSIARHFTADCSTKTHQYMRPSIVETHPDETRLRSALGGY